MVVEEEVVVVDYCVCCGVVDDEGVFLFVVCLFVLYGEFFVCV